MIRAWFLVLGQLRAVTASATVSGHQAGKDFRTVDEGAGHIGQSPVVGAGVAAQRSEQG
ncbi:hypothetical protein GCM10022232_46230 [Streptomyces plumbiresistens]|uniref:Secreted protein n=1 Tax=Streptomyces plumbiresistens TaxID=511811 RepID=A0ABP7RTZ0_9ACTN